ncbi:MAG: nucleotide exchange factor GrpE [Candidatus Polarisedimenticolaceae bacterium]|nr:nucleotide exchange factor GrpE [Candidatus Polarisedimenticolaceae bacterium]
MTSKQEAEQTKTATEIEQDQSSQAETLTRENLEIEGEVASDTAPDKSDLAAQLEEARRKADENWDLAVRAKAELENLRKRHDRDLSNAHKYALERFVNELLPVRDSLELGLKAAQEESADRAKLCEGTELTLNLFSSVLEKFNVAVIDPEGEPFNPELHQAMAMQPAEDVEPNTVITVVQKGYSLNGRLVRPAMVIVSQAASKNIDEQG